MTSQSMPRHFLDQGRARILAGAIGLACLCGMALLPKPQIAATTGLQPAQPVTEADQNPQYIACRDERQSQFEKLRQEGTINDEQYERFLKRALNICASETGG